MKLTIWGCRGSFPKPYTTQSLREKQTKLLSDIAKDPKALSFLGSNPNEEQLRQFLDQLQSLSTKVYGGNTSCYSLEIKNKAGEEELVILDAGSGITELGNYLLRERIMKGKPVTSKVFFTHVHGDHIEGWPFFVPAYIKGNTFTLYGMPNVVDTLAEEADRNSARVGTETRVRKEERFHTMRRKMAEMQESLDRFAAEEGVKVGVRDERSYGSGIELAMANNTDRGRHPIPFEVQRKIGASVNAVDLNLDNKVTNGVDFDYEQGNHPDGILMYKFREGDRTFVNTGDWEHGALLANAHHRLYTQENTPSFDAMLAKFLIGADVVLTDSQYNSAEYDGGGNPARSKKTWGHPTSERALEVAYAAAYKGGKPMHVLLTHHDPAHTDKFLDDRAKELQQFVESKGMTKYITFQIVREGDIIDV